MTNAIMPSWQDLVTGVAAGMLLAVIYLAALTHSVRGVVGARHPGRHLLLGTLIRLLLLGAVFGGLLYLGGVPHVLAAVAGFVIVRTWILRRQAVRESP